jgi:sigma-E factor negative regulatory protein RseC
MIEQTLTVEYVKYPTVFLKAPPKQACEGCNGKCGSQVFSKLFSTEKKLFPIELSESVVPGQKITLSLDDSHVIKHAFIVYMIPLIFAFISLFISALLFNVSEPIQIIFTLIGGFLGYLMAKHRVKRLAHSVKVIKIYPIGIPMTQIDGD